MSPMLLAGRYHPSLHLAARPPASLSHPATEATQKALEILAGIPPLDGAVKLEGLCRMHAEIGPLQERESRWTVWQEATEATAAHLEQAWRE